MLAQLFGTTYPRVTPKRTVIPTPSRCEGGAIRGPRRLMVLVLMAVAMLLILLSARHPAYAWPALRKQYPKPKARDPVWASPRIKSSSSGRSALLLIWNLWKPPSIVLTCLHVWIAVSMVRVLRVYPQQFGTQNMQWYGLHCATARRKALVGCFFEIVDGSLWAMAMNEKVSAVPSCLNGILRRHVFNNRLHVNWMSHCHFMIDTVNDLRTHNWSMSIGDPF